MKNRILNALSPKERRIISPHLRPIDLERGALLCEGREGFAQVYFLEDSLVSYLSGTAEGETIEVCLVGNEGVVGISAFFGESMTFRATVQVSGTAFCVSHDIVKREFMRCEGLHNLLLRYTHALLVQTGQTAVCNKFHSIEERFCRWLLMAQDRIGDNSLQITQDAMARVLGSRRASVTVVAGELKRRGLIGYGRGMIVIKDRKRLQAVACECYEAIWSAHSKLDRR